jgi:hypothetical protein
MKDNRYRCTLYMRESSSVQGHDPAASESCNPFKPGSWNVSPSNLQLSYIIRAISHSALGVFPTQLKQSHVVMLLKTLILHQLLPPFLQPAIHLQINWCHVQHSITFANCKNSSISRSSIPWDGRAIDAQWSGACRGQRSCKFMFQFSISVLHSTSLTKNCSFRSLTRIFMEHWSYLSFSITLVVERVIVQVDCRVLQDYALGPICFTSNSKRCHWRHQSTLGVVTTYTLLTCNSMPVAVLIVTEVLSWTFQAFTDHAHSTSNIQGKSDGSSEHNV